MSKPSTAEAYAVQRVASNDATRSSRSQARAGVTQRVSNMKTRAAADNATVATWPLVVADTIWQEVEVAAATGACGVAESHVSWHCVNIGQQRASVLLGKAFCLQGQLTQVTYKDKRNCQTPTNKRTNTLHKWCPK